MQNVFFLVGPTAVGKTALAVDLAARHDAEIISADAYQVYRGFGLLTAKPSPEQQRRVAHRLVSMLELSDSYSVARFAADATHWIEDAARRGKSVLVVGGNGLYVKALTHGLAPLPPASPELRAELEALPTAELLARLAACDPATAATIDRQNRRRLVRALEVCVLTGQPFSSFRDEWRNPRPDGGQLRGVFLRRTREDLAARIDRRVDAMFIQGVLEEVRAADGVELSATARQILGLADVQSYLAGRLDLNTCKERIKTATRQYAKRQRAWFQREICFEKIDLAADQTPEEATALVEERLSAFLRRPTSR